MVSESEIPQYPALARAVVVDSRFSSRSELSSALHALQLFDQVVEAPSIRDGLKIMSAEEADVCIVGASVSTDIACDFLLKCQECRLSKDCALVAVASVDTDSAVRLQAAGALQVLARPFTRRKLFDAVVDAVVQANANSPWRIVRQQELTGEVPPAVDLPWVAHEETPEERPATPLQAAMRRAAASASGLLREIAIGLETGKYVYDANGRPSRLTLSAVKKVASQIVEEKKDLDAEVLAFRDYLESVFTRWVTDLRQLTTKEANERLRLALISYGTTSE